MSTAYSVDTSANDVLNNKKDEKYVYGFRTGPYHTLVASPGFSAIATSTIPIAMPSMYTVNMWVKLQATASYTVIDSSDSYIRIMVTGSKSFSSAGVIYVRAIRETDLELISFSIIRDPDGDPWRKEVTLYFSEPPLPYSIRFQGL
jgi:hypothetical protein